MREKKAFDDDLRKQFDEVVREFKGSFPAERRSWSMPSLIDIRRRIRSVRNTQQITKAMKMISAAAAGGAGPGPSGAALLGQLRATAR
jgi:hypothetical protein